MADNGELNQRIQIAIDNSEAATSIKDLRKSLRELQSLAIENGDSSSEAFGKIQAAAGEVSKTIREAREQTKALAGEPMGNLTGSIGLVGESIKHLNFPQAIAGVNFFANSLKSIKAEDITKGIKDLSTSLLELGKTLLTAIGKNLSDRFSSLKDGFSSLGTGIKKAFGGDLTSGLDAAKQGFQGIGDALKVNPLFLIVGAVILIITKFEELKEAGGLIGRVFAGIGEVVKYVIELFTDFTDAIGLTSIAANKQTKQLIENKKREAEAIKDRFDAEIALAAAAGKDTTQLELEKTNALLNNISIQKKALEDKRKRSGELNEEEKKDLIEIGKEYVKLKDTELIIEEKANQEILKINKKFTEQLEQNAINLIADKNEKAKAQAVFDAKKAQEGYNEDLSKEVEATKAKYNAIRNVNKENHVNDVALNQKEINDLTAIYVQGSELKVSTEKDTQKKIADVQVTANKEASDKAEQANSKAKAAAKKSADEKIAVFQNTIRAISADGTIATKKQLDDINAVLNAEADFIKKNATTLQLSAEDAKSKIDVINAEQLKNKKTYDANIIALTAKRDEAISQLAVLNAKNADELLAAQLKQIQDKANKEISIQKQILNDAKSSLEQRAAAEAQYNLLTITRDKEVADLKKKNLQKQTTDHNNALIESANFDVTTTSATNLFKVGAQIKALKAERDAQINQLNNEKNDELSATNLTEQDKADIIKKYADKEANLEKDTQRKILQVKKEAAQQASEIASASLNAISALNDLVSQNESQNRKLNEKEQIELEKKQFERGKALAIVSAVINTANAIIAQMTNPTPWVGFVLSAIAATTGALNIAKIASQQFNPTGGSSTGSGASAPSAPSTSSLGGSGGSSTTANSNAPSYFGLGSQTSGGNNTTGAGSSNNQYYVVATDVTNKQNQVNVIQSRASIKLR